MEKNLSYFMREENLRDEIISVPGIDSIKDENGEIVPFEVKVLSQKEIQEIHQNYTEKTMLTDKLRNPLINGDRAVFRVDVDEERIERHILVEALRFPNLKDEKLMDFYKCYDVTDMPLMVFKKPLEYNYVRNIVNAAQRSKGGKLSEFNKKVEEAKN